MPETRNETSTMAERCTFYYFIDHFHDCAFTRYVLVYRFCPTTTVVLAGFSQEVALFTRAVTSEVKLGRQPNSQNDNTTTQQEKNLLLL